MNDSMKQKLAELSCFLYTHPETAMQEEQAAARQTALLKQLGWNVTCGVAGLPTAYTAEWRLGNGDGPCFAFFAEYDALPSGHACGHNLICVSALAAADSAVRQLSACPGVNGKIVLFGTPGEEQHGGKVIMRSAGIFDCADAGVISHPYDITSTDDGAYSVVHSRITFHGKASHAGMAPHLGINALDAMILFFNGLALCRQQLPEGVRLHGIISNGGEMPNIIPAETEALIYVRADTPAKTELLERRVRETAHGAAVQTGCTVEYERTSAYEPCLVNAPLNEAYADYMEQHGEAVRRADGTEGRASTDFGNVSQIMPGANLHFGICGKPGTPLHTEDFREAAGTDYAFQKAMLCGEAMAQIACRYFTDETFRKNVHAAWEQKKKQMSEQ